MEFEKLCQRLDELSDAVTKGKAGEYEFTMQIPANPERDADFVLARAAQVIRELSADKARLDWLADPANGCGAVQLPTECVERNLGSLRDAIDDAMRLPA